MMAKKKVDEKCVCCFGKGEISIPIPGSDDLTCPRCKGKGIEPRCRECNAKLTGRRLKYCSAKCKQSADNRKKFAKTGRKSYERKPCPSCGKKFHHTTECTLADARRS